MLATVRSSGATLGLNGEVAVENVSKVPMSLATGRKTGLSETFRRFTRLVLRIGSAPEIRSLSSVPDAGTLARFSVLNPSLGAPLAQLG